MKPARATRKGRRKYRKSGAYTLVRTLKAQGIEALDGRSTLVREARATRQRRAVDLGGEDALSGAQAELLDAEMVQAMVARHVGGVLAANPDWIINRRRRRLSGLAHDFFAAVRALRETSLAVADPRLKRVQKPVPAPWELDDDDEPELPTGPQEIAPASTTVEPIETPATVPEAGAPVPEGEP